MQGKYKLIRSFSVPQWSNSSTWWQEYALCHYTDTWRSTRRFINKICPLAEGTECKQQRNTRAANFVDVFTCSVYKVLIRISFYNLTFQSLPVTWCTNNLTFNNCTFCPHCIYVFCIYLRTNSDLCYLQHKLIGFNNRDEKCLLRGTNWVFK